MPIETEDCKMCCLCEHNKMVGTSFFCKHPEQTDVKLKTNTSYNDSCDLFEEAESRKKIYPEKNWNDTDD